MKRLAHRSAVLLHAGGLRRSDAHGISESLFVQPDDAACGDTGCGAAERPGQVPAAGMVRGRGLAAAHARLESGGVGDNEVLARGRPALGQGEERGEDRRAGMQDDASHVRVVEIEHVPHLAVRERRVEKAEPEPPSKHRRLRITAHCLQHADQLADRRVAATRQSTAEPVEQAPPRLVHGFCRQVLEPRVREVGAQRAAGRAQGVPFRFFHGFPLKMDAPGLDKRLSADDPGPPVFRAR